MVSLLVLFVNRKKKTLKKTILNKIRVEKDEEIHLAINIPIIPKTWTKHLIFFVLKFPHQRSSDTFKSFIPSNIPGPLSLTA